MTLLVTICYCHYCGLPIIDDWIALAGGEIAHHDCVYTQQPRDPQRASIAPLANGIDDGEPSAQRARFQSTPARRLGDGATHH